MAQLIAIGYTALGGLGTLAVSFVMFGCAVRGRSTNIAPRCTARSPDVIYNPKAKRPESNWIFWWKNKKLESSTKTEKEYDTTEAMRPLREHVQFRGGPTFGWIPWTLSLSYETLLKGVPGTGTRKRGMEGAMLKVNLDGIVLLRFHALAFRVVILTTILALGIILPMNLYAGFCHDSDVLDCHESQNITTYEMTTLMNIPLVKHPNGNNLLADSLTVIGKSTYKLNEYYTEYYRFYVVVIVSWIIIVYTMRLLSKEWVDALALRRVYYLESSHFENRREELEETAEYLDDSSSDEESSDVGWRRKINKSLNKREKRYPKRKPRRKRVRQPWIPHPEQRETVPNIELYSVLVGNIPCQPSEVIEGDDNIEAAFGASEEGSIHWQLQVATTFFDQCVPNQPGFSSSVAAVTILPDAPKLALAWRKWYRHVGLLRKLRFVRLLIADMRHYDINCDDEASNYDTIRSTTAVGERNDDKEHVESTAEDVDVNTGKEENGSVELDRHMLENSAGYNALWKRMNYKYDVFGTDYEEDVVSLLVQAMDYGPEQTAVYSREFAQGAAACCPNGCAEERTRDLRIDELLDLELEVKLMVEESFNELQNAQLGTICTKNNLGIPQTPVSGHTQPHESEMNTMEGMTVESQSTKNRRHMDVEVILKSGEQPDVESIIQKKNFLKPGKQPNYSAEDLHAAKTYEVDNKLGYSEPFAMKAMARKRSSSSQSASKSSKSSTSDQKHFMINGAMNEPRSHTSPSLSDDAALSPGKSDGKQGSGRQRSSLQIPEELPVRYPNHRGNSMNDTYSLGTGCSRTKRQITMSNECKVYVRDVTLCSNGTSYDEHDTSTLYSADLLRADANTPIRRNDRGNFIYSNAENPASKNFTSPPSVSTRHRFNTANSYMSSCDGRNRPDQWAQVEEIINNSQRVLTTGVWEIPEVNKLPDACATTMKSWVKDVKSWASRTTKGVVDELSSDANFAVVTFTSRQAAVAARQCLADGRGEGKWEPVRDIPVPPLADGAAYDFKTCRQCCRPVSLTINPRQQLIRKVISWVIMGTIYLFSTVAINMAASLIAPEKFYNIWPALKRIDQNPIISGIIPALLFSLFFALCPIIFKAISNFGSNAVSVNEAEYTALQYYWWFMLITAFCGTSIGGMVLIALNEGRVPDNTIGSIIEETAASLATQVSANWLNWIIFRTFLSLPLMYMLQVNSFIFGWLGFKCCRRCVMGGGPGGPIPYRIYIDSGVVFLCAVSLSPVAPLVAPAAFLYFLYCTPLWRRNLIFMYRPKFDTGGLRWPFLADVILSSLLVGQTLLMMVMILNQAAGPSIMVALSIIHVILHRRATRHKYLKSYTDAALLQTSQLDNWDASLGGSSEEGREQYRKFLVDAHKAAYVPICIAGGVSNALTAEPAVSVPHVNDQLTSEQIDELSIPQEKDDEDTSYGTVERPPSPMTVMTSTTPRYIERANQQVGAVLRRLTATVTAGSFAADECISLRSRSNGTLSGKPRTYHQHAS